MKTHYYEGKVIWITGASSGIGRGLVEALYDCECHVFISARRLEILEEIASKATKATITTLSFDVDSKEETLAAAASIEKKAGKLDIVILNAGYNDYVDVDNFSSDLFETLMTTNYLSVIRGIEASLPLLRKSKSPHIVGVSSVAGYLGLTKSAAYCASKSAIRIALQALQVDFGSSMPITIVCPGFVKTPLTDKNTFEMPFIMTVKRASKLILSGIAKQKEEVSFPFIFSMILKVLSSLPAKLRTFLVRATTKAV